MAESGPQSSAAPEGRRMAAARKRRRTASVLLTATETGGRCAVVLSVERRGDEPPRRVHHREDAVCYVLTGELTYYVDGATYRAAAGACIYLPRDIEHTFLVHSPRARVLTVYLPGGFEGYERDIEARGDPNARIERMIAVAADYGCEITGPPRSDT